MKVKCLSCDRRFDIGSTTAAANKVARCVCGARLLLTDSPPDNPAGPRRLGKYVLFRRIAVGGMGEVFLAKQAGVEGFEREVAIKKMLPHLSEDRAFVDMMVKEAKLTVLLNHPNIVQVFDLAREGSEYYIAMEYVPGVTLGRLLELKHRAKSRLPIEVAVHITMQVLRGLSYAHEFKTGTGTPMHILHRDITPQNILVTREGWVKITDFGIAKARNEISTTSPGMIKGKLGYIAPEQITGGELDHRMDLFCAAILMWEALATKRLFKGADEVDTFRLIAEAIVPPLSNVRSDVPPELEAVLQRGLRKDPADRYLDAQAFLDGLAKAMFPQTADDCAMATKRHFAEHPELFEGVATAAGAVDPLDGVTMEMSSSPTGEQLEDIANLVTPTQPMRRKRRWLTPVLLFLLLAAMGGGGFFWWTKIRPESDPTTASPAGTTVVTGIKSLSNDEVQLAVDGEKVRFLACYRSGGRGFRRMGSLSAKLVIPSTGGVAEVELVPAGKKLGSVGSCVLKVLEAMKFRSHDQPVFRATVVLPPPPAKAPIKVASTVSSQPLSGDEIQATIRKNSGPIAKCLKSLAGDASAPSRVDVTITIAKTGRVREVRFRPVLGKAKVEQCLRRALQGIHFKNRPSAEMRVTVPLTIQQI